MTFTPPGYRERQMADTDPPFGENDRKFMEIALALAAKGRYTALPNPCVGCVIVRDGEILGRGYHKKAGTPHAEINAMADAAAANRDVRGATVYVTLEPCSHFGLTPPCAAALIGAGVGRVVCAMGDPNPLVSGRGFKMLADAGVEVRTGLCSGEAEKLNVAFLHAMRTGRPYVTQKMAVSLDGKIALKNGRSKWITSAASRSDAQALRAENQALMTTADTVIADDPQMNVRPDELPDYVLAAAEREYIRSPVRVIVDKRSALTMTEKIFSAGGKVLWVKPSAGGEVAEEPVSEDVTVVRIPVIPGDPAGNLDIGILLGYLHSLRIRAVLVESGSKFCGFMTVHNLIDKLVLYAAPKILGADAVSFCGVTGRESVAEAGNFRLEKITAIGDDVKLEYIIKE